LLMEGSMAVPTDRLRLFLNADEPNYAAMARLGPSILPQLAQLLSDRNQNVAANAASLAGMIRSDQSIAVLERAARSSSNLVRVAAASALRGVQNAKAGGLIASLLNDRDKGVRKFAIKAAATRPNSALAAKVAEISKRDPVPGLRSLAQSALGRSRLA
jgi:HEAT repeat protein